MKEKNWMDEHFLEITKKIRHAIFFFRVLFNPTAHSIYRVFRRIKRVLLYSRLSSFCKAVTPARRLLSSVVSIKFYYLVELLLADIRDWKILIILLLDHDEGTKDRPYGYAVVAGVERSPLKVTKAMGKKKTAKRSKVKPFVKIVNYNHMMPTRYGLELEQIKGTVSADTFKEPTQREDSKKVIKKLFEERYQTGKNKWFFSKLRF
ncbi:60S ribosomal protein L27B [Mucor circinelloides]